MRQLHRTIKKVAADLNDSAGVVDTRADPGGALSPVPGLLVELYKLLPALSGVDSGIAGQVGPRQPYGADLLLEGGRGQA